MKLLKINPSLNEAIENIGSKRPEDWGDSYRQEVDPVPQAVMPVSFTYAVEQVKQWREAANKAIEERRKEALKAVEAADEDRFNHMTPKEEKFNKGEKITLSESLITEEVVRVSDEADKLLVKLVMADFHDWQQLALDLLDNMSDEQVVQFVADYAYDVDTPGVVFSQESAEELSESKESEDPQVTTYSFEDYQPWNGAIYAWERIRSEGKLSQLEDLVAELFPKKSEFNVQTLNDLLWFDRDFIFEVLGISDTDAEEENADE